MKVKQISLRRNWAATMIQKYVRGRRGRLRVSSFVKISYDRGMKKLKMEMEKYWYNLRNKACMRIAMCYKYHKLKKRVRARTIMKERTVYLGIQMDAAARTAKVKKMVYMQLLEQWFLDRKRNHLENLLSESLTAEQRSKVLSLARSRKVRLS